MPCRHRCDRCPVHRCCSKSRPPDWFSSSLGSSWDLRGTREPWKPDEPQQIQLHRLASLCHWGGSTNCFGAEYRQRMCCTDCRRAQRLGLEHAQGWEILDQGQCHCWDLITRASSLKSLRSLTIFCTVQSCSWTVLNSCRQLLLSLLPLYGDKVPWTGSTFAGEALENLYASPKVFCGLRWYRKEVDDRRQQRWFCYTQCCSTSHSMCEPVVSLSTIDLYSSVTFGWNWAFGKMKGTWGRSDGQGMSWGMIWMFIWRVCMLCPRF